jgi:hypothetical protein
MKGKVIMIFAFAFMLLTFVPLAMATPGNGQKVPASITTIGSLSPLYTPTFTNGGIVHLTGTEVYFNMLTINGQDYNIYSYNEVNDVANPKAGLLVANGKGVWYVTDDPYTVEETSDGFAVTVHYSLTGVNPVTFAYSGIKVHALAHGFGVFEGQTLELSYAGAPGGVWTGICIKG